MKILIVTAYFPPQNAIASLRPYSWAKYWSRAGHEVEVLTMAKKRTFNDLRSPLNGFAVHKLRLPALSRIMQSERLRRAFHDTREPRNGPVRQPKAIVALRWVVRDLAESIRSCLERYGIFIGARLPRLEDLWIPRALQWARPRGWDAIVSTSGPYLVHLVAHQLKRKGRARVWIADYRDLWTGNPYAPGLFPFSLLEEWLERKALRHCDAITTVSGPLAGALSARNPRKKVHVVENGFDSDDHNSIDASPAFPSNGKLRLVYTGTIIPRKRDPSPLFKALSSLRELPGGYSRLSRLEVVFAGLKTGYLSSKVRHFALDGTVTLFGTLSRDVALRMQRDADVLLLLESMQPGAEGVLTGKIFEYLHCKAPIWGIGISEESEAGKLIMSARAGIVFGTDSKRIMKALVELTDDRSERITKEVKSEILRRYDRGFLANRMLSILRERLAAVHGSV
jgi:glycosyltransferase involved in cell wall biosynthesis